MTLFRQSAGLRISIPSISPFATASGRTKAPSPAWRFQLSSLTASLPIEPVTPSDVPMPALPTVPEKTEPTPVKPEEKAEIVTPSSPFAFLGTLKSYFEGSDDEPKRVTMDGLQFDTGKATLNADGKKAADELASFLKDHPKSKVQIEGFTDSTGNPSANMRLSTMRAEQLRNYLVKKGVGTDRIERETGSRWPAMRIG